MRYIVIANGSVSTTHFSRGAGIAALRAAAANNPGARLIAARGDHFTDITAQSQQIGTVMVTGSARLRAH